MYTIQKQTLPHTPGKNLVIVTAPAGAFHEVTDFKIKFVNVFIFHF